MVKTLRDVADVHYGKSQNGVADQYGQFPIIGTGGVIGNASTPLFNGPAIVVGRKGTLDNPLFVPGDFWAVDTTYAVLPKENFDAKWLYFTLCNSRLELLNEATGVPSINRDRLLRVPVHDIDHSEQIRIAYVLDTIDEAIDKTEALIAKLKQVRAGLLHDLLIYGLDENGHLRDPIAHPGQFKDSHRGRIPREWDIASLVGVADIIFSNVDKLTRSGESPVRLCNYTDVYNNDYITADMEFMHATATLTELTKFVLNVGDVIITKDSETPNDIGISTVVTSTAEDLLCGYHLALIRPNDKLLNSIFLSKQLESGRLARYFARQANGTTRYGLSIAAINNTQIYLPKIDEQILIAERINESYKQIETIKNELTKLSQLKSGLQDDLLTGRVPVPERINEGAALA